MSVIFGKCNFEGRPFNPDELTRMQERLNHWQADKDGTWIHSTVGLGHLMLYNTPQSLSEVLPYYDSTSQLAITADARLDNRDELIKKLDIKTVPAEVPDSLLILKAYQNYGSNCMQHFLGDFAFAIYNEREQELFCGRDHLGVKPFFYSYTAGYFAFASEKKGILALPDADRRINRQYLFNQLASAHEQNLKDTLYEYINKLEPAHFLIVKLNNKSCRTERYWWPDVHRELKLANRNEYYEGLRHHFEQAVQCRTVSAYTIGVELSGGMDSSAITGAAHTFLKQQNKSLVTLSNTLSKEVTNPEIKKLDERRYIDAVIAHFDITDPVFITEPAYERASDEIRFGNDVNDGLERWNPLWQIPLKKAAQERNIRTLLSGFPGDELVTYRGKYYFLDYLDKKQYLKYALAEKKYPGFSKMEPLLPFKVRHILRQLKYSLGLFQPESKGAFSLYNIPAQHKKHLRDSIWLDPFNQEQFASYRHFQRYRILKPQVTHRLESETRYGIHFRTEPRFPMADIRLIQYYLSMPNDLKYEGELTRTAYRKAVGQYLPPLVLQRNDKYGSVAPFLSIASKLSKAEMQLLIMQLPDFAFLKKDIYLKNLDDPHGKKPLKYMRHPPAEVIMWLVDNKDWLKDL